MASAVAQQATLADIRWLLQLYGMKLIASQVIAQIEATFPARRTIAFHPIVNSSQGHEPLLTAAALADKDDWTALGAGWLDEVPEGLGTALHFLSDEAICFYIPAFLVADLRGELRRAEPLFHLTHGFDDFSRDVRVRPREAATWTDLGRQRWSHLTIDQARAIVQYLEWSVERDAPAASEALRAFWYDRASLSGKGS